MKKIGVLSFAIGLGLMVGAPAFAALKSEAMTASPAKIAVNTQQFAGRIADCYAYRLNTYYSGHNLLSQIGHAAFFGAFEGAFTFGLCVGLN